MRHTTLILGLSALLASCAPSTTDTSPLKGPLVEGETWSISGFDQNNDKMDGRVVIPANPDYDRTDREWIYSSGAARVYFTESDKQFQVWDTSNPKRLLLCIVRKPFDPYLRRYDGISVAGSMAEINAVFAKLSGSGTKLIGGSCTVSRL